MRARTLGLLLLATSISACVGRVGEPPQLPGAPSGGGPGGTLDPTGPGGTPVCNAGPYPAKTDLHRLTPAQYQHAILDVFDGAVQPSAQYPGAYGKSVTGYSTEEALNEVGDQSTEQLMNAAEEVALALAPQLGTLLPCSKQSGAGQACVDTFLSTFGKRAYRRPLTPDEHDALSTTWSTARTGGASFSEAVAIMSAHLLQSPQFLYWVEDAAGARRALSGYELASRLSLMLWDSVPDDALLAAADDGTLAQPEVLAAQASRLLASPKADTALARLLREWTATARLTPNDKDAAAFPTFDAAYAQSMNDSFDLFARDQLRAGTVSSLLTSTDAYVDAKMAAHYGVAAPPAGQWQKVQLDGSRYSGVMTQALVMATESHVNSSSYVFRGRTVLKRLLAQAFPAPPADAQAKFAALPMPTDPTGKDVSQVVNAAAGCSACHRLLDPPGLAYEHFDGLGQWRDAYSSGKPVDTTGTMALGSGSFAFTSPVDLASQLAQVPELQHAVALQLFRFAFSRQETAEDACAVQSVQSALKGSGGNLGQALLAVTATDAFSWRADP